MQKKKNLFLIIVDQLRYDYKEFLPLLSKLAPISVTCEINSIPTSSETQHTVISTGKLPRDHGVFGKDDLEEFILKTEAGEYTTIAKLGASYGFETNAIIGKSHLARILGSSVECAIRVYLGAKSLQANGYKYDSFQKNKSVFESISYDDISPEKIDSFLIPVVGALIEQNNTAKQFYIVSLPSLDYIGHLYGPKSESVIKHLGFLDKSLGALLSKDMDCSSVVIVGDHGCRTITNYVIESNSVDNKEFSVYSSQWDNYVYNGKYKLSTENIQQVIYDGGILRIFGTKKLIDKDIAVLSLFGDIIENATEIGINSFIREVYRNSKHTNLGDCVVVAKEYASFCKATWLDQGSLDLVQKCEKLKINDLPLGEHGTYHPKDRRILFMTNHPINFNYMTNVDVRNFIEDIMKKS